MIDTIKRTFRTAEETCEWQDADDYTFCPYCCRSKEDGHAPDCKLDLALRQVGVRP